MSNIVDSAVNSPHILVLLYMLAPIVVATLSIIIVSLTLKHYAKLNIFVKIGLLFSILNSLLIYLLTTIIDNKYSVLDGVISSIMLSASLSNIFLSLGLILCLALSKKESENLSSSNDNNDFN